MLVEIRKNTHHEKLFVFFFKFPDLADNSELDVIFLGQPRNFTGTWLPWISLVII